MEMKSLLANQFINYVKRETDLRFYLNGDGSFDLLGDCRISIGVCKGNKQQGYVLNFFDEVSLHNEFILNYDEDILRKSSQGLKILQRMMDKHREANKAYRNKKQTVEKVKVQKKSLTVIQIDDPEESIHINLVNLDETDIVNFLTKFRLPISIDYNDENGDSTVNIECILGSIIFDFLKHFAMKNGASFEIVRY